MTKVAVLLGAVLLCCTSCDRGHSSAPDNRSAAATLSPKAPTEPPVGNLFPTAIEVRLFVNTGYDQREQPVYSKPKGLALSVAERATLESLVTIHTITPDEAFAACFMPHHFFRYYDRRKKVVGELSVCFCCSGVEQSGSSKIHLNKEQTLEANFDGLKALVQSMGERTDVQCGEPD